MAGDEDKLVGQRLRVKKVRKRVRIASEALKMRMEPVGSIVCR